MERAGAAKAFAADILVQAVDPVNYIPIGSTAFKGATIGTMLYRGAKAGVAGAAIQEPVLQATQEIRTWQESALNIGASAVFGLAIGGGAHIVDLGRARWGNVESEPSAAPSVTEGPQAERIRALRKDIEEHVRSGLGGRTEADPASQIVGAGYELSLIHI